MREEAGLRAAGTTEPLTRAMAANVDLGRVMHNQAGLHRTGAFLGRRDVRREDTFRRHLRVIEEAVERLERAA